MRLGKIFIPAIRMVFSALQAARLGATRRGATRRGARLAAAFVRQRRAGTATEFALISFALLAFLMAIVNLGLLGFSAGALVRGVESAARAAAVQTAAAYAATNAITCPSESAIVGYFNQYADPPLPAATGTTGNPAVTATWSNNGTDSVTTEPPGVYLTLTATYKWTPIGFAPFGAGINLSITTVATVTGTAQANSTC